MGSHECDFTLYHLEIPLLRSFSTATGSVSLRHVGLVSVTHNGITGWGEATPYPGQDEPFGEVLDAARNGGITPTLAAAVDEAIGDLTARERGEPIASELGSSESTVPISIAVGTGDDALTTIVRAARHGVVRFKVKIMPGRTSHVVDIRQRMPGAVIGIDANGSFDASTMQELLALGDLGISYVEQPTAAPDDPSVRTLRDAGFRVFVDESIRSVSSAERALAIPAVSGVVVKPGRLGWRASIEVVRKARSAGKLWRASGLLETSVGRAFTLALAAVGDAFVSDVAPASHFLSYDVVPDRGATGVLVVPTGPGTGVDVDTDAVRDHALEVIALSVSATPGLG